MYCKQCGQAIGTQSYCQYCGAPSGLPAGLTANRTSPFAYADRVARHLHTLGILWVVFAGYLVLRWLLVLPFLRGVLGGNTPWLQGSDAWMYGGLHSGWLLQFIAIAVFVRAILSLAVGIALLTRQPWGRIFAIVIAVLTLLKPVLGTILAIYTLWALLSRNAGPEYHRLVRAKDELVP